MVVKGRGLARIGFDLSAQKLWQPLSRRLKSATKLLEPRHSDLLERLTRPCSTQSWLALHAGSLTGP